MLDEQYTREQIADYGTFAQPAIAARMRGAQRMARIGDAAATLAAVLSVLALINYPHFTGESAYGWAVTAVVTNLVMMAIVAFQHLAWSKAMAEFTGVRDINLDRWAMVSWIVHLVSYPVLALGIWSHPVAIMDVSWLGSSAWLLLGAWICFLLAHGLGAVQYVRTSGPPGTLPTHFRRLIERAN